MYVSGKDNPKRGIHSESEKPAVYEGHGVKVPQVTGVRPEAGRSIPGQGEAEVTLRGGLKKCYGQVFF